MGASRARVWQSVLDREHLPWLHPESSLAVKLRSSDREGWPIALEVRFDRERLCYVARTLEGPGAENEIWTTLAPRGERATGILVELCLAAGGDALGPAQALRERLPACVEAAGSRPRVVELDGRLLAYAAVCLHLAGPLEAAMPDDCPWHGYRFDLRRGRSADGRGLALDVFDVEVDPVTGEARPGGLAA